MLHLSLFLCAHLFAKDVAQVRRFTPSGETKHPQQIRVEFSAPLVRFGARGEPPVTGECLKDGEGRWIDSMNWVYDFKRPLGGGFRCVLKLRDGLNALDGHAVGGTREFSFTTGGPAVVGSEPAAWNPIDEDQAFILALDSEADPASVAKSVFLSVEGLGDRLPVEVVGGSDEEKILRAALKASKWSMEENARWRDGKLERLKPLVVVRSPRRFPYGGKVTLTWGAGVTSRSGVASKDVQTFEYTVRPDFTASFSCEREEAGKPCIPLLPMTVNFTTPVKNKDMADAFIVDANGAKIMPDLSGRAQDDMSSWFTFPGPFREGTAYKVNLPSGLKDETGRSLSNAAKFPLETSTGRNPPILKFAAEFGVIEAGPLAALPVTVRDIEAKMPTTLAAKIFPLKGSVKRVPATSFASAIGILNDVKSNPYGETRLGGGAGAKRVEIPKPNGEKEFEVIGLPFAETGFYFVEMESPRLGAALLAKPQPFYVRSTVLVTSMAVHLKFTTREVFAWVTRLKDSSPVAGADVQIIDCKGNVVASTLSAADGTARLSADLGKVKRVCPQGSEFFVGAAKDGDFTFTSSEWDRGIETWRYRVNTDENEPTLAHTVLDRNLLRPGETLSMKHVLRKGTKEGFAMTANSALPAKMTIEHESETQSFDQPLRWNKAMGTAEAQWKIPMSAKLGRWHVILNMPDGKRTTVNFRVEHYKVPLLKGAMKMPDGDLVAPSTVPVHVGVEYLAGGSAGPLEVKTRWVVEASGFSPKDDELTDFAFLNGGLREGTTRAADDDDMEGAQTGQPMKGGGALKLDANGTGSFDVRPLKAETKIRELRAEVEYRDPNGEIQTVSSRATLWPSSRLIGVRARGWGRPKDRVSFEAVVLDLKEKPVVGAEVEIEIFKSESISHRKRLVGGFYAYESYNKIQRVGRLCKGRTDARGRLACQGAVADVGSVQAVARLTDGAGKGAEASATQWVVDNEDRLWFGGGDADRADLLPVKKRYEPGETAELLFQPPFRQAKVLLTIEREGVIEHRVVDWDAKDPAIKIPVKESWAPNVFVSALALRGRVDEVKPTALVDLGKPAFKMGLTEIRVGWKKHELKVKVATDAKAYPVRGRAKTVIKVTDSDGKPTRGEISLAAVDEGLLQLLPNSTWQLLDRMMDSRGLLVKTATGQSQIIGKRHFGLKSVPAGGDGGRANLRELFDTLLLWKGTIPLDAKGEARVEIPINDSLTSFRVVAIALNGRDQFGTGWTSFRTTQDLMLFSGAPTVARRGDRLVSTATVRNTGAQARTVTLNLKTEPSLSAEPKTMTLAPGQSMEVAWTLDLPSTDFLASEISVADGTRVLDRMKSVTRLEEVWRPSVRQSTLTQIASPVRLPIESVTDAIPGTSTLKVEAAAGLASGRSGLSAFWENYRFNCLEQRTSRAVTLKDPKLWKAIEADLDSYIDSSGKLRFFPGPGEGDVMLNAYVLRIAKEAGFGLTAVHEKTLLEPLVAFAENRETRSLFAYADEPARRVTVLETLSRYGQLPATGLSFLRITPNLWPTSTVEEWFELVRREAKLPQREKRLAEAENILRSRMTFTGAKFAFSDEKEDAFWWLYRSAETPTARLILAVANDPAWKKDLPRVLRGFIEKQREGAWSLTTSNAWGRLALDRYQSVFEKEPVTGRLSATLGPSSRAWSWGDGSHGDLVFDRIAKKDTLELRQEGQGQPYAFVRAIAAVPLKAPVSSGFFVERRIEAVQRKSADRWTRGDLVKVVIQFKAQSDAGWVVLDDPLPPGGIVLGSGFGNDSALLNAGAGSKTLWTEFEERAPTSFRQYFRWVPQGAHTVEYRMRLNQAGVFHLPGLRVSAMYDPDVFAETPVPDMDVRSE